MRADEAMSQGRRLLERCLKPLGMRLDDVKPENIATVLKEYGFSDVSDLLEDVGLGNRPPSLVVRRLVPERTSDGDSEETKEMKSQSALAISGTEGMVVSYGRCCSPIPGDQIVAKLSKGRGIVVHRETCKNLEAVSKRTDPDKYIDVNWAEDATGDFNCVVKLEIENKSGLLARTATVISDCNVDIENVEMEDRDGFSMNLLYSIKVSNRKHLAMLMRRLRRITHVIGTYSQAVKIGTTVYLSGQIPLVPETMEMVDGDIKKQIHRVFKNLLAVTNAAGGDLSDIVKLNIFLTDLSNFPQVNEVMAEYFQQPYPARAAIGVSALPKDAGVEMDGVMEL
jgi:reactive intermediate/imine deaminase